MHWLRYPNVGGNQLLTLSSDTSLVKKTADIVAPHLEVVRNDWIKEMWSDHERAYWTMESWADLSLQHEFHELVEDHAMSAWLGYLSEFDGEFVVAVLAVIFERWNEEQLLSNTCPFCGGPRSGC